MVEERHATTKADVKPTDYSLSHHSAMVDAIRPSGTVEELVLYVTEKDIWRGRDQLDYFLHKLHGSRWVYVRQNNDDTIRGSFAQRSITAYYRNLNRITSCEMDQRYLLF